MSTELICIDNSGVEQYLEVGKPYIMLGWKNKDSCDCSMSVINIGIEEITTKGGESKFWRTSYL